MSKKEEGQTVPEPCLKCHLACGSVLGGYGAYSVFRMGRTGVDWNGKPVSVPAVRFIGYCLLPAGIIYALLPFTFWKDRYFPQTPSSE